MDFSSLSPCWFFIRGGECRRPSRYCTVHTYFCTVRWYFWRVRPRSDARRVREPDHRHTRSVSAFLLNRSSDLLILTRQYFFWFDFLLMDEIVNLRICRIQWWICESSPYGWHRLDVNLTCLESDLGQARQKYHRTVHKYLCTVHN